MQFRTFAERVLLSTDLTEKLKPYEGDIRDPLCDVERGKSLSIIEPGRPDNLKFALPREAPAMPKPGGLHEPQRRGLAHHILANHELQALEVMAWAVCAFPDAPFAFRAGVVEIMADEQRHTRMHVERARKLGVEFGEFGVNCYIWKKAMDFTNVLEYLAGLPLVFEGANLDLSLEFADAFEDAGDARSAALMRVIHHDEIGHVKFGLEWLRRLKPDHLTDFEAFEQNLHWPLRPSKSRSTTFQKDARKEAGMDDDFISQLESIESPEKNKNDGS